MNSYTTARQHRCAFTRRCNAMGAMCCQYTHAVRDIGFAKKFNGREFYGGGLHD